MFKHILYDLKSYVKDADYRAEIYSYDIPTAILLTGVNLPDHKVLFDKVSSELETITPYIARVWSRDSGNVKSMTEEAVYQLINSHREDEDTMVRKSQCTLRALRAWHEEQDDPNAPLVIIIPDFESFSATVLRDFILALSSYTKSIKFVLIFGVATTLHAVHRTLPYDVTSKLRVQVFHTQTQMKSLSDVLEGTVLSSATPFKLTGRAFQLLTDIFLFYDFSVDGFLQGYKLCMMQHFYDNNVNALCCKRKDMKKRIDALNKEELEEVKRLPSIEKYMKNSKDKSLSNSSDKEFKEHLYALLDQFQVHMSEFLTTLKILHGLTSTLPNAPLGKQLREVYAKAVSGNLTESQEYKESLQLLGFLSKEEMLSKLDEVLVIVENSQEKFPSDLASNLKKHVAIVRDASLEIAADSSETVSVEQKLSRLQLKEKLLRMSQRHSRSPYKQAQMDLIEFLDTQIFSKRLMNPNQMPGHEIFCFGDGNTAKHHIRGSLRAAIHTALNDPRMYLECNCCKLDNDESILTSLPDLSIIYKLHLESGKLINMYDWLQAFLTIVNPNEVVEEQREVDPKMQARFTRAVAELQFLGFIKSSRKKTDHVKRLT
ncbi:origin recognition complex subunit 3 isoform X2 [Orussus abietinus]|nr:origin recognition complex subunit 3 isoform X2 [Orussus abietinus]